MASPAKITTRAQTANQEREVELNSSPAKSTRSNLARSQSTRLQSPLSAPAAPTSPVRRRKKKTVNDLDIWDDADEDILGMSC
jgi:hypothetical protein